jgi:hypothetical protein
LCGRRGRLRRPDQRRTQKEGEGEEVFHRCRVYPSFSSGGFSPRQKCEEQVSGMSRLLVTVVFSARVGRGICPSLIRPEHVTRAEAFTLEPGHRHFTLSP